MNFDFLRLPMADFSVPQLAALAIPIASIVLGGVIVVSGLYFQHRRRQLWHETARLALEKGQPLPPLAEEADSAQAARTPGAQSDFRTGLILLATGAGLFLFLGNFVNQRLGYVGAIPGLIGVALLVHGLLSLMFRGKPDTRSSQ